MEAVDPAELLARLATHAAQQLKGIVEANFQTNTGSQAAEVVVIVRAGDDDTCTIGASVNAHHAEEARATIKAVLEVAYTEVLGRPPDVGSPSEIVIARG